MLRTMTLAAALVTGLMWRPVVAQAQSCAPYTAVEAGLLDEFGEMPAMQYEVAANGGGRIVIFVSPKTLTVSVLFVKQAADGSFIACPVSSGEHFGPATIPGKDA